MSELSAFIEVNAAVMMGKPVIKGTRIPVELILDKLAAGVSEEELLADYPRLSVEAIHAALAFAAETLRQIKVYSVAS